MRAFDLKLHKIELLPVHHPLGISEDHGPSILEQLRSQGEGPLLPCE